jgi:predicted dehydrogenase
MSSLRVVIVGFGLAGEYFHAPFVAAAEGMEVAAVVTRDEGRRASVRERYPKTALLDSPDDVWANARSYDLAVIAAPNDAHAPLAIAALEAGLHVVVDKPMAANSDDARAMIAAAGASRKVLTVFHNRRWDSDFLTAQRLIADGLLGEVTRFESRFERWRPKLKEGAWRESADASLAGGVLWDLGPHLIDQACVLFGPPVSVYAEIDVRRPGAQVDDDVFLALEHPGGVRSHLYMSQTAPIDGPRLRVTGLNGAYEARALDPQEDSLRAGSAPGGPGWGTAAPGLLVQGYAAEHGVTVNHLEVEPEPGNYLAFYDGVREAIVNGAPPPVDPQDGLRVIEIVEDVVRQAAA